MKELTLKEFQKKYGIRRLNFSKIHKVEKRRTYASDKMICPYCGTEIEYEAEDSEEIIQGTPWQCSECEKWFYVDGEMSIETTCTPIENKVLEPHIRRCIEESYSYMDKCDADGCKWSSCHGVVEWKIYKEYGEPLFENLEES